VKLFLIKLKLFIKKYWKAFVFALALGIAIMGLYWVKGNYAEFQVYLKRLSIMKNQKKIDDLNIKKEESKTKREIKAEEVKALDEQISALERDTEKKKTEVNSMTMSKKLKKFDDLGY
jgi:23S rRNA pseudoU1915 N3-methylase RlmH